MVDSLVQREAGVRRAVAAAARRARVVLADDLVSLRLSMADMLRAEGHEVPPRSSWSS